MRPGLVAVSLLSTGCQGDILPVDLPGPEFFVEAQRIPGAMRSVRPGPNAPLAVGGSPEPAIFERDEVVWLRRGAPEGWRGTIRDVWSGDQLWVVGDLGQIARGGLAALEMVDTGTPGESLGSLHQIFGEGDDVFIAAGAALLHHDGETLTASVAPGRDLRAIWGEGGVSFAVGSRGEALRIARDGIAVTTTGTSEPLRGVHGRSASDVYAVGGGPAGVVLHFDGSAWTEMTGPDMPPLYGVFASSSLVWVSGSAGYLAKFDGVRWKQVETTATIVLTSVLVDDGTVLVTGGNVSDPSALGFVARYTE